MRLLRLQHVAIGSRDRVFRHSRMRALIVWLAGFAATAAFFFNAYTRKWPPGYFFGSFLLLFVLLTLRMVTARFHPSYERDGNLRAISFLSELPVARR